MDSIKCEYGESKMRNGVESSQKEITSSNLTSERKLCLQPLPKRHKPDAFTLEYFHIFMIPGDNKNIMYCTIFQMFMHYRV